MTGCVCLCLCVFLLRVCGAQPLGPGPPVGVLLAGGADDWGDMEVGGPSRKTHLLPRPQPEQVPAADNTSFKFNTTLGSHMIDGL